jgi:hypothetical protein
VNSMETNARSGFRRVMVRKSPQNCARKLQFRIPRTSLFG